MRMIAKFITALFLLIISYTIGLAQDRTNSRIDSLINSAKTLPDDSLKVNTLISIGNEHLNEDVNEAIKDWKLAIELAQKINYSNGEGYALKLIGQAYARQSNYPSSIEQFNAALKAYKRVNNKEGELNILSNLGSIYFIIGDDSTSIEYHLRSLKISEDINDKFRISVSLSNIGAVYANQPANDDKALRYFLRAYTIFEEINYSAGIGIDALNIGEFYFKKGKYDSALIYFERSIEIYTGTIDSSYPLIFIGQIYTHKKEYPKALSFHNKAIEICERLGAKFELAQSLLSLGETQVAMGELRKSIDTNLRALQLAKELDAPQERRKAYESLSKSYAKLDNFSKAYHYEKLLTGLKDTLYDTNEDKKIQQLQMTQKLIKAQFEIKAEEEQKVLMIQNQKTINYFVFIGIISAIVIGGLTLRFYQIRKVNRDKHKANVTLENTLKDLKITQSQLIQSEKMAALGELTAGIAHEIQNPLNFVNNFSELNKELIRELRTELKNGNFTDADAIANDIEDNEEKIKHHGKRAEGIVKGMLQHSRTSSGVKEPTDINALADEYLRLAYHGLRAKDKTFNAKFETSLDSSIPKINIIGQDIGRVILNLINNAFYAVNEKNKRKIAGYEPTVIVCTKKVGAKVSISVKDNGDGIPDSIKEKIFQPFFTTKPTGQGTGLGLSLSYDIVKAHGGELKVETMEGVGSEFVIHLPT